MEITRTTRITETTRFTQTFELPPGTALRLRRAPQSRKARATRQARAARPVFSTLASSLKPAATLARTPLEALELVVLPVPAAGVDALAKLALPWPETAFAAAPPPAANPVAPAPYKDRVIAGGDSPMDVELGFGEHSGDRAKGLPRTFSVELRAQQESGSVAQSGSRWLVARGSLDTLNYGALSFDAAMDLGAPRNSSAAFNASEADGAQTGGLKGSFSLYQRAMPLTDRWFLSNTLGLHLTTNTPLVNLQYRFGLPSRPIFGLTTALNSGAEDWQFKAAWGDTVQPSAWSQTGMSKLGGKALLLAAERRWVSGEAGRFWEYAVQGSTHQAGSTKLSRWGVPQLDSQGLFQTLRNRSDKDTMQFNWLVSKEPDSPRGQSGLWADVQWDDPEGQPIEQRWGVNHFNHTQSWLGSSMVSPSMGGYYRWRWNTPVDNLDLQVEQQRSRLADVPMTLTQAFAHGRKVVAPGVSWGAQITFLQSAQTQTGLMVYRDHFLGDRAWKVFAGQALGPQPSLQIGTDFSNTTFVGQLRWSATGAVTLVRSGKPGLDLALGLNGQSGTVGGTASLRGFTLPGGSSTGSALNVGLNWRIAPGWSLAAAASHSVGVVVAPQLGPGSSAPALPGSESSAPTQNFAWLTLRYDFDGGQANPPIGGASGSGGGGIEGLVFLDDNANGLFDATEKVAPNVTVTLNGRFVTRTDSNGRYQFAFVAAGSHRIEVAADVLPLPWNFDLESQRQITVTRRSTTRADFSARRP
jgi:SdrD B-like domain